MSLDIQGPGPGLPLVAAPVPAVAAHGASFHDILSAMNPLQYLPVVGTLYRAVTGDVIPEALRRAGSMAVSALLGGPIGLGINIVTTLAEKITGIDPEKIVSAQFTSTPARTVPRPDTPIAAQAQPGSAQPVPAQRAWTPAELAAYGVVSGASGAMKLGDIEGADVLNTMQLFQLGEAVAAYSANQTEVSNSGVRGG
jgi:hypothetical protein